MHIPAIILAGIVQKLAAQNSYLTHDTIVLETEKAKGFGMFPAGTGKIHFIDTSEQ